MFKLIPFAEAENYGVEVLVKDKSKHTAGGKGYVFNNPDYGKVIMFDNVPGYISVLVFSDEGQDGVENAEAFKIAENIYLITFYSEKVKNL